MAAISLAFVHLCGLIGLLCTSYKPWFELATPFNLLLSSAMLIYFHKQWNHAFISFIVITLFTGYWVEVLGVHTTFIFGSYRYGPNLGFKIWEVPVIIGINWFMLVYATGSISSRLPLPLLGKVAMGALLMVLLDFFIEPFAITHRLWLWEDNAIPLQNYLAWYIIGFLLILLYHQLPFKKDNVFAKYLYLIQLIFFVVADLSYLYHKTF